MNEVFIGGAGMTPFGRHPDRSLRDLGREAAMAAMRDAALSPRAVDAVYCGNALGLALQGDSGIGQAIGWELGICAVPVFNVSNACASGSTALHQAWRDISAGHCESALVIGVEKAAMPAGQVLEVGAAEFETRLGDIFPGLFAMVAQQHMARYGTTLRQMAQVSVKNHGNGCLNPYAQFNRPVTVEEVLASPMIADPLTLFACCPNSDGAAAIVLRAGRRSARDVRVAASVLTSGTYLPERDFTSWDCERRAALAAYRDAAVRPSEIDVAEVHDAFTICEIVHCEALGFCDPGQGGQLTASGATAIDGDIAVNPSGGLQARGHPPGASGIAQIFEIVAQLRGEAQARQVRDARIGLAQIMGGSQASDAQACTVHVLCRE
ncbi:MAG: thiolase family protein [Burkholderiaceae bacterium]|nr:thiolase family protein [Burkholderiaceae bacterium]